jgi:predicted DNA-binding transcriptional regulator AlpA
MSKNPDSRKNLNNKGSDNPKSLSAYRDLLSVEDLAEIFETTKSTIYKEIKSGKFGEPLKIGRKYIVPKVFVYNKFFKA